jgi:hypothetical protein
MEAMDGDPILFIWHSYYYYHSCTILGLEIVLEYS